MYSSGRLNNGALSMWLGGKDDRMAIGISGGWVKLLSVPAGGATIKVSFDYQLFLSDRVEPDEFVEAIAMIGSKTVVLATLRGNIKTKQTSIKPMDSGNTNSTKIGPLTWACILCTFSSMRT